MTEGDAPAVELDAMLGVLWDASARDIDRERRAIARADPDGSLREPLAQQAEVMFLAAHSHYADCIDVAEPPWSEFCTERRDRLGARMRAGQIAAD